jgi:hypothetical protein
MLKALIAERIVQTIGIFIMPSFLFEELRLQQIHL